MTDCDVTCGTTKCEIHVEARPTVNDGPIFIAIPVIVEDHTLVPIVSTSGSGWAELPSNTETGAVDEAITFLERRFGPPVAPAHVAAPSDAIREIRPARSIPRRDQPDPAA